MNTPARPRLLLVGTGRSHLRILSAITALTRRRADVTVVNDERCRSLSRLGPGLLSGRYRPGGIRFDIGCLTEAQGGRFIAARCAGIRPDDRMVRLENGDYLDSDVLSIDAGSEIGSLPGLPERAEAIVRVKPVEDLIRLRRWILSPDCPNPVHVTVAGGGAAGVETAVHLKALDRVLPGPVAVSLISGGRLLSRFPPAVRQQALDRFGRLGIALAEHTRVIGLRPGEVEIDSGDRLPCDRLVLATGARHVSVVEGSGLAVDPEGRLRVNAFLQSLSHPEVFGGGHGIVVEPEGRRQADAGVDGGILLRNLRAALFGEALVAGAPRRRFWPVLDMGDTNGVAAMGPVTVGGFMGFLVKSMLDRRCIKALQPRKGADPLEKPDVNG
jgi:NADH dehydrogenase FAD-containing subunit